MPEEPLIYARMCGAVLEVATDRLTLRSAGGALVAIEDHLARVLRPVAQMRVMTLDEAPWVLSRHTLAPPLHRAA